MNDAHSSSPSPDPWRQRADPHADAVICQLYAEYGIDEANRRLSELLFNDQPLSLDLPPYLRDYLIQSAQPPAWQDDRLIAAAQELFADRGPLVLISLVTASLAECYALGNGVQVLYQTHRMDEAHVYRRIYETAQFVIDVATRAGLAEHGRGLRAIQKVRLMHASIRHLLLSEPPSEPLSIRSFQNLLLMTHWDANDLGLPICQQDLAFTLQSFGLVVLRSVDRLGSPCSAAEQQAWIHLWAVVGHHLGVDPALIPRNPATADTLYHEIRAQQQRPTPEGRALTRALGTFISIKLGAPLIGQALAHLLIRWQCDAQTAAIVGVPPLDAAETLLRRALLAMIRLLWRDPQSTFHQIIGRALVLRLTRLPRGWQRGLFFIPDHLVARWSGASSTP